MADDFMAIPPELRAGADAVAEIGSRVAAVMASLQAQVAGEAAGAAYALTPGDASSWWSRWDGGDATGSGGKSAQPDDQLGDSLAGKITKLAATLRRDAGIFEQSDDRPL